MKQAHDRSQSFSGKSQINYLRKGWCKCEQQELHGTTSEELLRGARDSLLTSKKSNFVRPSKNSAEKREDRDAELERTHPKLGNLTVGDGYKNGSSQSSASQHSSGEGTSSSYQSRGKKGEVVLKYNTDDDLLHLSEWGGGEEVVWSARILSPEVPSTLKFMFQKSRDMALAMDEHATNLASVIAAAQNLDTGHSLKVSTTEDVAYIGRIRSDGKMTAESVYFEGVLESSQGHVVSLDVSQLQEYFLFPGQVLAVVGRNSLGKCVTVSKIIGPHRQSFSDAAIQASEDTSPLTVLVAAGPFTPSDSLAFEPVQDLAAVITETRPDICIVMGPVVDAKHPVLQGSSLPRNETFEAMVQKQVDILDKATSSVSCQLILVSNHKDAHHHHTFPTPPYHRKDKCEYLCVPDPTVISIGGVVFGLSSTDVLMHMGKAELASGPVGADRLGRLAGHLLSQRNFYPLYPSDESLPLDVEHWHEFAQMPCQPHVLILPSELRYFIKEVDGTVVVNPQHVTKGQSGGFYARLRVQLPSGLDNGSHSISKFIKADIVKI